MKNDAPDFHLGRPLPGYRPMRDVVREVLPSLTPPARTKVSEAALRRKINAGGSWVPWDNSVAPYMVEPMDMITSRVYDSLVFVGPARSSKTEALVFNPLVHAILAQPRLVAVFHMGQAAVRELSVQELGPMIRNSPDIAARLRLDNDHDKRFAGGARITLDWPVSAKLSGRSVPLVLLSDYDHESYQNVQGEGPAFNMGRARNTSAGSRGMTVAETSPRYDVLDESWSPKTPHEAPPCEGALGIYNSGTRGRLYWQCRDCGGWFEVTFDRLTYPDDGTPAERGKAAYMCCLHCGSVIEPRHKVEFNRSAQWFHEGRDGTPVPITDPSVRDTPTLSYWLHGPAAALAPWSRIVTRYLTAEETFQATGNEGPLKGVVNIDLGLPYTRRAAGDSEHLSEEALRENATDHQWQAAPAGTQYLIAAVDVQRGRFVVQVMAHLADNERVVIDRFDLHTPPDTAPRAKDRQIDPGRYGEDWDALLSLADLTYPVAASDYDLRLLGVVIDAGGAPGVTPNAYAFYRKARRTHPRRFHLIRGFKSLAGKRAEVKAPETAHRGKRHVAKDVLLIRAATDDLKDEVAASLTRQDDGTRAIHIPRGAPKELFAEFAAERRGQKGWEKRPGINRNEALDLAVYDLALAIVLSAERIDPDRPPAWAIPGPDNSFAVRETGAGDDPAAEAQSPRARKPRQRRGRQRFDGW